MTRDSAQLKEQLISGELFAVHAAPDNVIAWTDGGDVPFRAWLAGSNGPITLVARGPSGLSGLRGAKIGVDSPSSGFATILRRLLATADVGADEVELVAMGATRLRYSALLEGAIDATMLTLPWSLLATQNGAAALADHALVAPGMLTSCAASTADRLERELDTATAYAEAIDAAMRWLRADGSGDEAATLLAGDMDLDLDDARSIIDLMRDPEAGWPSATRLRGHELEATWQLRSQAIAEPSRPPSGYVHALSARP